MSKQSDSQLGYWLDKWASWKRRNEGTDAHGYPSHSIEQASIRSSLPDYIPLDNDHIEQLIDRAVNTLPFETKKAGRIFYRVEGDGGSQAAMAVRMGVSRSKFLSLLADFKNVVRSQLIMQHILENPYEEAA